jgi:hypothetical protein
MTLDVLEYESGTITVSDLKTGQPHAGYREQVTLGVLAAARHFDYERGVERLVGQLVYTRGGVRVERWEVDGDDLAALREKIADRFLRAEDLDGRVLTRADVTTGEHCRWCRSRAHCPAQTAVAHEIARIDPPAALARFDAAIATDDGAAEWWTKLPLMRAMLDEMAARLDARAEKTPFALADGSVVGPVTERGDRYVADVDAVHARIAAAVGAEKADEVMPVVTKRKAGVGAIEKALGKPAMRELETAGLVRRGADTTRVGVTKAAGGKKGKAA